ncbi:type II toxin-antitoxin system HipA family toxin [Falsihalocynthiibacter arcticus]|nr:type II toxin-antitoxin system HipA family toxin [Falsihalocynthiibacter arcticus]
MIPVGRLIFESDGRRSHSTFIYDQEWLVNPIGFDLCPSMPRHMIEFHHSAQGRESRKLDILAGPFADTAPDSWGRKLLRKILGEGATEFDFLVASDDTARQGALRFLDHNGDPFLSDLPPVPHLTKIDDLRRVTARFERDPHGAEQEVRELAGAAGSLGGARPKANVIDGNDLWIVKFTSVDDTWPVERMEVATLKLASRVGIRVPEVQLALPASDHPVALIKRFDRRNSGRVPYISARTALGVTGTTSGFYTEIADALRTISVNPEEDMRELWTRMLFGILITNTDDHLKNHGLLYVRNNQWRLSPMFDVNPQPKRHPKLETGISPIHGFDPSVENAIDAAPFFGLNDEAEVLQIVREMSKTLSNEWREALRKHGITGTKLNACAQAFEHDRMEYALSL